MTVLYAIRTGETTWERDARLDSATGAPLTAEGRRRIEEAAGELTDRRIRTIYSSGDEAEAQTTALIARALGLKGRTEPRLREIDYGLWQGLTEEEIRRRHSKAYRAWREAPGSVRPPGGETVEEVRERLRPAIREISKRHKNDAVLLVLRPVVLGVLGCLLEQEALAGLWRHVSPPFTWQQFQTNGKRL